MYCSKCGYKIEPDDLFCPNCRTKQEQQKKKKDIKTQVIAFYHANKKPVTIFSIVLLVCGMGMIYNLYSEYKDKQLWEEYRAMQSNANGNLFEDFDFSSFHKYENSTYKVGTDMPAGEYVLYATSGLGYFCVSSDSYGNSIVFNDNFEYNSIVSVEEGEYIELSRCYAEPIKSAGFLATTGSGMFKIGEHLPAGEYKLRATDDRGYYCVYNDSRHDNIETNDNFSGRAYVSVRNGQYLLLSRCEIDE